MENQTNNTKLQVLKVLNKVYSQAEDQAKTNSQNKKYILMPDLAAIIEKVEKDLMLAIRWDEEGPAA